MYAVGERTADLSPFLLLSTPCCDSSNHPASAFIFSVAIPQQFDVSKPLTAALSLCPLLAMVTSEFGIYKREYVCAC